MNFTLNTANQRVSENILQQIHDNELLEDEIKVLQDFQNWQSIAHVNPKCKGKDCDGKHGEL